MSGFFDPAELSRLSSGRIKKLPPCVEILQGRPLQVVTGQEITHSFPVSEQFTNILGSMQGGFITAAFDNVFGHLGYTISAGQQIVSLNISTTYIKPIFPGDELNITVRLKHHGKSTAYMEGKAVNKMGETIAYAQTNLLFYNDDKS